MLIKTCYYLNPTLIYCNFRGRAMKGKVMEIEEAQQEMVEEVIGMIEEMPGN